MPPRLQELKRKVKAMTVEDRMLLGTALDQMLTSLNLQMRKAERAAQGPAATPSGDGREPSRVPGGRC